LIVGMDARPALFGRTGFGRVVRETLRALHGRPDIDVRPYGAAWRRPRGDSELPGVAAPRIPARLQQLMGLVGFGVETLLGPLDVYHHTDLVFAPVARTPEVLTIYDLVFLADSRWHGPGFAERVLPRLRARAAAAQRLVVPCTRVADDLVRHGLAEAARIVVAPLGADHVDAAPLPDDAERVVRLLEACGVGALGEGPLVLLPGTREPRKNQRALLEVFLDVARGTEAVLLFAGPPGWGCEDLEARLRELERPAERGTRARVGVAGEIPEADLAALYRSADLVAYPSLAEGFGLPVAEAMACGKAVLTSRGTPMADFGAEAVVAVDPGDRQALAAGLRRLLHDPDERRSRGAAGAAAIAPYTWAAHTDVLVDVYRSVVS